MRVVLTGGPHAGKSTLLAELAARGVRTVQEAALSEIEQLVARYGAAEARTRRRADMRSFQIAVSHRQAEAEAELDGYDGLVVFDRGVHDGVAYCTHHGFAVPDEVAQIADETHYDLCVVCELVLPFEARSSTGRTSDEASARQLESLVADTYRARGIPVVRLPMAPIDRRADALLSMTHIETVAAVAAR